jgi:hypothetical protein
MSPGDRAYLDRLLEIHQENVRKLELQKAQFGAQAPLHILNELDHENTQIEAIERQIHPNDAPSSPSDDLQFVNQLEALDAVLSQPQANNFVIDAPVGYGKTRLLKELSIRLAQRDWYIRTISFDTSHVKPLTEHDAIGFVARHLDIKQIGDAEEMGRKVAEHLHQMSVNSAAHRNATGTVLILDSIEQVSTTGSIKIYHELRAFFEGLRRASEFFDRYTLRIILAGRYISRHISIPGDSIVINLRPFDLSVIRQAIDRFFEKQGVMLSIVRSRDLAQHVLYLTGGHPEMIRRVLMEQDIGLVHNQTIDLKKWMSLYTNDIRTRIVKPTIDSIRGDIPQDLWNVLEALSVFRRFNRHILKQLPPREITGYTTHFELIDGLKQARLIKHTGSYFEDGVLRPSIVRWLQFFYPDRFQKYCQTADDILAGQLSRPVEGMTRAYILKELLYIALIRRYQIVLHEDAEARETSLRSLYEMILGHIRTIRASGLDRDGLEEILDDLLNALQDDADLSFLFDYIFDHLQSYSTFIHKICDVEALEG